MEQLDIFGAKTHEYLLVIEPDTKTAEKIIEFKHYLNTFIPLSKDILQSKPHISLCYFEASDFSDELIISKAEQVISSILPFEIILNGCEKWKNGTFILKIDQGKYMHQLCDRLSVVFKGVIRTPHLTIARNLSEEFHHQIELNHFQYTGSFICESVVLLKRTGTGPYQTFEKIQLSGK